MHGDDELHEASVTATGGLRRAGFIGVLAVAVVVGVEPLLGSGGLVSELWLGTLISLAVLLLDGHSSG